jgi:hypothetical protein
MLSAQTYIFNKYAKEYNLIYITYGSTSRSIKYFIEDGQIPYHNENTVYLGKDIKRIYDNSGKKEWKEYAKDNALIKVLDEYNIQPDIILNWGTPAIRSLKIEKILSLYNSTKNQNFHSTMLNTFPIHIMYYLLKENPNSIYLEHTIDVTFISLEAPDLTNKMIYIHENSIGKYKRMDFYQYYLINNFKRIYPNSDIKDLQFVFGMSSMNHEYRKKLLYHLKEIINNTDELFYYAIKDTKNKINEDKLLPRAEYNKLVERAKYSLIIPAYDKGAFSITRLCDIVYTGCCPLFEENCAFNILEEDFGIEYEKLKPFIVDILGKDKIEYPSDEQRDEFVEYLYEKLFTNLRLDFLKDI